MSFQPIFQIFRYTYIAKIVLADNDVNKDHFGSAAARGG